MKSLLARKIEYVILLMQQEILREFVCDYNRLGEGTDTNPIEQLFHKHIEMAEEYEKTQFSDVEPRVSINGYCGDENISHYDIDKALNEVFGDMITTDSESGGFYAYCDESKAETITAWLKVNYPSLKISKCVREDKQIFGNYFDQKEFIEFHNVVVPSPIAPITEKLDEVERLKKELEEKVKSLEANLLTDDNTYALTQMELVDDKVKKDFKKKVLDSITEAKREENYSEQDYSEDLDVVEEWFGYDWYAIERMKFMIDHNLTTKVRQILYRKENA